MYGRRFINKVSVEVCPEIWTDLMACYCTYGLGSVWYL